MVPTLFVMESSYKEYMSIESLHNVNITRSNVGWKNSQHYNGVTIVLQRLKLISRITSKRRITGLLWGNPPETNGFPSQVASNVENVLRTIPTHGVRFCLSYLSGLRHYKGYVPGPILGTWFKFNPGMDKWSHVQLSVVRHIHSQTSTVQPLMIWNG